ncbi:MAG: CCA tRNA nucleotidyltransferase [Eubacteriales bacterium]
MRYDFPLPEAAAFALDRLHAAGYHAYVVGGCVRDFLMGRTPGDYDITTSARPEQTLAAFSDCRMVETGLKHGTVTLVRGGMNIEITTYRVDGVYLDGRHPENVTFTDDLAEDLCRRDFTVNAMAYSPSAGIVDYHGGADDIRKHIISCVGSAEKRFSEDGLRILRALRFASTLDFSPDTECSTAIRSLSGLLDLISRERIDAELTKLLAGAAAPRILRSYPEVVARVLPGLEPASVVRTADCLERARAFLTACRVTPEKAEETALNYALLFADADGNVCREQMRSLKPSRDGLRAVERLHAYRLPDTVPEKADDPYAAARRMKEGGAGFPAVTAAYQYALGLLCESAAAQILRTTEELRASGACVCLADLRVSGRDLTELGLRGKAVGQTLDVLLDRVMRGELANERAALLDAARAAEKV